jgi:hypothetical protein
MAALLDARLVVIRVAAVPRLPVEARDDLLLLGRRLSLLLTRDNGRR